MWRSSPPTKASCPLAPSATTSLYSKLEDDAVLRLDKVVFDILGLTEDERKQVYDGLNSLRSMRLKRKEVRCLSWYGSHSVLNEYIRKNSCRRIMEIGVLDGENARTMIEAATQNSPPEEVEYYGFDFFSGSMFHQVGQKLEKTRCKFKLFKGDTVDTLPKAVKSLPKMDLIFINGGKSYTEAKSDWEYSKTLMHDETAVFVHNYYFSGVRRMVDNIPRDKYQVNIIHPPNDSDTALIKKKPR